MPVFAGFPVIAFVMFVPTVIVLELAVLGRFPVTFEVFSAFITRRVPDRFGIRRASPIALVPLPVIAATYRVPVTFDPNKLGPGTGGDNPNNPRRRRWSDLDSD